LQLPVRYRYYILDDTDLFPLRKEPVLSEAEGGLGGCNRPRIRRINTDLCIYLIRKLNYLQNINPEGMTSD